jgi:xylulokinase
MPLVAGVDSSTQSCTIVLRDADDGRFVATSEAPHPATTPPVSEQHPDAWWEALAAAAASLDLRDVAAVSVDGQGHGLVALDRARRVIRPAKLWNDTTSAAEAAELVARLGAAEWARRTGIVPVSAITIAKLLWLKRHEPGSFARLATILLPPNYLAFRLTGEFTTDRSEAAGTGYWSPMTGEWDEDLLRLVDADVDWRPRLPRILGPRDSAGTVTHEAARFAGFRPGTLVGPGANDQPVNALALGIEPGDVLVSIGTSGTISAMHATATADPTAAVTGVADASGVFLPLVCTLNATKVTDAFGRLLGVDHDGLASLALAAPADPDRPVLLPYLDGERTPSRPRASGVLSGLRSTSTREQVARAAFEGVICGLLEGLDALVAQGVSTTGRLVATGGGAHSRAYLQFLADLAGRPVHVSDMEETSASGSAVQAAAVLHGVDVSKVVRAWAPPLHLAAAPRVDQHGAELRDRYRRLVGLEGLDGGALADASPRADGSGST